MTTKSELISGMGVALSLVQGLVSAVREVGGAEDQIHELVTEQGKLKLLEMARIVAGKIKEVLLRKVATVHASANKKFALSEAVNISNVGWMSEQFKRLFGDKVEEGVPAATIAVNRLERNSTDPAIVIKLGGKPQMPLAYLFELMEKQSQGQEGVLLVNGYANIVYAVGNDGNIWAVSANWHPSYRYWHVNALSVAYLNPWLAGLQILSCDS